MRRNPETIHGNWPETRARIAPHAMDDLKFLAWANDMTVQALVRRYVIHGLTDARIAYGVRWDTDRKHYDSIKNRDQ